MRALVLPRTGLDHLAPGSLPPPEPGRGQVRIKVEAAGLNPVDVMLINDGHPKWTYPVVPGLDACGIVDEVAEGLSVVDEDRLIPGTRVVFHGDVRRCGAFAQYVVADALTVAVVPPSVDPVAAAALPCAGMTAFEAIRRRLHVAPGDVLLVSAGAGGVGGFAVQLGARAGARVIASASKANHARLRELGASDTIDYHDGDVAAQVLDMTNGAGVDAIVDAVSAESAAALMPTLVHGGGIACVAGPAGFDSVKAFTTAPSIHEIALGAAHAVGGTQQRLRLRTMLDELLALVASGRLEPMVSRTFPLDEVPAALAELAGGHVRGKLVGIVENREAPSQG